MNEQIFFNCLTGFWFLLAIAVFVALFFISAPYGRFVRKGWGTSIPARWGWLIMEAPASLLFALFFIIGTFHSSTVSILFLVIWESHYIYRAFIYPFTLSKNARPMPLGVIVMAFIFNTGNSYINGRYLYTFSGGYPDDWLLSAPLIAGFVFFAAGYIINRRADYIIHIMRRESNGSYLIPKGFLYSFISSPNYFGEIIQWIGWAFMTWSIAGLAFAFWTMANLVPRAYANHIWYRSKFPDYPHQRKVLIPGIW